MSTPYHAKYYAHELTRRGGAGVERLSRSLFDAAVDLNPHQIEAALFAVRSPISKGALLADEVGLDPFFHQAGGVFGVSLVAHLGDDAFFTGKAEQIARFGDHVGQRFLDISVFAHFDRHFTGGIMGVVRCRDGHGVDLVIHLVQQDRKSTRLNSSHYS